MQVEKGNLEKVYHLGRPRRGRFFFFFLMHCIKKVTFAVAVVAESLQPPWVLLVPARSPVALHSV